MTREAKIIRDAAENTGLFVLAGAEVTTREEVHCLAFFEEDGQLTDFQTYLDTYLPDIPNNPEKFGYQVVADIQDNIIYEEPKLLISAITPGLEEIEKKYTACKVFSFPLTSTKVISAYCHNWGLFLPLYNAMRWN